MQTPPVKPGGKEPRPGSIGFLQDRIDYIKEAFHNYIEEADARRKKFDVIMKVGDNITVETKPKKPADRKAREAGMVEKLK
jgi:hypothetical protein